MTKITFSIPRGLADRLRESVAYGKRSVFVAGAIEEKLDSMDAKERERQPAKDYAETREEDRPLDEEFTAATLEGWPEY